MYICKYAAKELKDFQNISYLLTYSLASIPSTFQIFKVVM